MKKGVPSVSTEELKTKIDKLEKELEYYRNKEHSSKDSNAAEDYPSYNNMLSRQNVISNLLLEFPKEHDHKKIINGVLNEILEVFESSLTYIYIFTPDQKRIAMRYGATKGGKTFDVGSCMEAGVDAIPWWSKTILAGKEIVINDINAIKEEAPYEYDNMSKLGFKSAISYPLTDNGKVWAFIGASNDKLKVWSKNDIKWFSSIANIINLAALVKRNRDNADRYNEELKKQKSFLEDIFDNIPIAISIFDENTYLKSFNSKFIEMFGITNSEEVLGKGFFRSQCSKDTMDHVETNDSTELHIDFNFDKTLYHSSRSGNIKLSMKSIKLYDGSGKHYGFVNMSLEDTDRFLAMSRIHEFENFFSIISDFAKIGYAKVNIFNHEGYAIRQWYKNLGETETTPLRNIVGIYKNMHPEDCEKMKVNIKKTLHGKLKSFSMETRVRRTGVNNCWNWLRYYIVTTNYAPENGIVEIIGVNYDITELKEKTDALRKARDKAEATDKLKSAFLANMSHEIRTPLNAIVGFSNLLCESENATDKVEFRSIIHSNSKVLLQLISDILDLSKMESGSLDFVFKRMDVNSLCNEVVRSLQNRVNPNVNLSFGKHLQECHIVSDVTRLQQLLTNFLTNAIKHTEKGEIQLGYNIVGSNLVFYVSDTGTGIPKELQRKIFDRFVKLDNFTQGTGLGLSICKNIAKQLGGKITLVSVEGKGSTFSFTMPYGSHNK